MAKEAKRPKATAEDAELILRLYDPRREAVIRKARQIRKDMGNPDFMAHIEELADKGADGRGRVKGLESRIAARFARIAAAKAGAK